MDAHAHDAKTKVWLSAESIRALRKHLETLTAKPGSPEAAVKAELMAHTTLALRHAEDADSRLARAVDLMHQWANHAARLNQGGE